MKSLAIIAASMGAGIAMLFFKPETENVVADQPPTSPPPLIQLLPPASHLFPVSINNRVGFIDSLANLRVPAIYESSLEFSEGLCPVRRNGLYGFIDLTGNIAVEPKYDFAFQFTEGLAVVFLGDKPCVINRKGEIVIGPKHASISGFINGYAYVRTAHGHEGMIDKRGRLVIDTLYSYIGTFVNGQAVAYGAGHQLHHSEDKEPTPLATIIDTLGNQLIPFGKYREIRGPFEGYFTADPIAKNNKDRTRDVILNTRGDIVHVLHKREWTYDARVSNGILKITRMFTNDINAGAYDLYITAQGKVVFTPPGDGYGKDFKENFAFYNYERQDWLINRAGKKIAEYHGLSGDGFYNGRALVNDGDAWGIIDTTGAFVVKPSFNNVENIGIVGDVFFYSESDPADTTDYPKRKYGVADVTGKIVTPAVLDQFDERGFAHGLIKVWKDNRMAYINRAGQMVWQDPAITEPFARNIDHMQRGYYYASGREDSAYYAAIQKIPFVHDFPLGQVAVTVRTDQPTTIEKLLQAHTVYITNTTGDDIIFNAQDSRLYMKLQALDARMRWQDIEYIPNSWCGNSYHSMVLPDGRYWQLATLKYEGSIHTKMRLELTYVDPTDTAGQHRDHGTRPRAFAYHNRRKIIVYSNEFDGRVNPGQFWRRPDYFPQNIMDPYWE